MNFDQNYPFGFQQPLQYRTNYNPFGYINSIWRQSEFCKHCTVGAEARNIETGPNHYFRSNYPLNNYYQQDVAWNNASCNHSNMAETSSFSNYSNENYSNFPNNDIAEGTLTEHENLSSNCYHDVETDVSKIQIMFPRTTNIGMKLRLKLSKSEIKEHLDITLCVEINIVN